MNFHDLFKNKDSAANPTCVRPSAYIIAAATIALLTTLNSGSAIAGEDDSGKVLQAWSTKDIDALAAVSKLPSESGRFASGALLSLKNQNRAAISLLDVICARAREEALVVSARHVLAEIYLRQGLYAKARSSLLEAQKIDQKSITASDQQTMDFLEPLAAVPAIKTHGHRDATVPVTRDKADLPRADFRINGKIQEAVLDTGANVSTITESAAKRLKLRRLNAKVSVGSATQSELGAQLAVADQVIIDNSTLSNVVFIVVPDASLSFANGAYKIDAIIGLPVFMPYGRVAFSAKDGSETVHLGRTSVKSPGADVYFDALNPFIRAKVDVNCPMQNLMIDSGGKQTILNKMAVVSCPTLSSQARSQTLNLGGAGGTSSDEGALSLPEVRMVIGVDTVDLKSVAVTSDGNADFSGTIGQDVLRYAKGYFLDFETMKFGLVH